MIVAESTDSGSGKGSTSSSTGTPSPKRRGKLSLVPPIRLSPDSPSPSLPLSPSTSLSLLLSDTKLRSRYKEGRYKPGTNVSRKMRYFPSHLSYTSSLIGRACTPKCSISIILSVSIHAGILGMLEWDSVSSLSSLRDRFTELTPKIKGTSVLEGCHLFDTQPRPLPYQPKTVILPEMVDDDLKILASGTGVSTTALVSIACTYTLSLQHNYLNKSIATQENEKVEEFRRWLDWKSKIVTMAVQSFEKELEANVSP